MQLLVSWYDSRENSFFRVTRKDAKLNTGLAVASVSRICVSFLWPCPVVVKPCLPCASCESRNPQHGAIIIGTPFDSTYNIPYGTPSGVARSCPSSHDEVHRDRAGQSGTRSKGFGFQATDPLNHPEPQGVRVLKMSSTHVFVFLSP